MKKAYATVTHLLLYFSPHVQLKMSDPAEQSESAEGAAATGLNLQEVMKLIGVFEPSFSFLLLQLVKLMTAVKRKPR